MVKNNNRAIKRRSLMKLAGAGAVGISGIGAASGTTLSKQLVNPPEEYRTLRGSIQEPVDEATLRELRDSFVGRESIIDGDHQSRLFLDVEKSFSDVKIVGYNILKDDTDNVREQFVIAGPTRNLPDEPETLAASELSLAKKADELLHGVGRSTVEIPNNATTQDSWEIDWDEWTYMGADDIYYEGFNRTSVSDAKPGNVEFTNEVRYSLEDNRVGARSKIRMEPGRELCKDGFDDYCTEETVHTGWRNREATVYHDWDQVWNGIDDPENLIVSTDPEGQIEDISTTRGASLALSLSKDPSLSIGYNSSVTMNGAYLRDRTSKKSGQSEHQFKMTDDDSESAKYPAVFEVGSVARFEQNCSGNLRPRKALQIDVDLRWGLRLPHLGWMNSHRDDKTFMYDKWC